MRVKLVSPAGIPRLELRRIPPIKRLFPPYGAGCLAAFLRGRGHQVSIDDLALRAEELKESLAPLRTAPLQDRMNDYLVHDKFDGAVDACAERLFRCLSRGEFDIAGFSVLSQLGLPVALLAAKKIKEKTGVPVVFGGAMLTEDSGYPGFSRIKRFLEDYRFVDYVIYGEGEVPFLKLIEHLQGAAAAAEVPSLAYRNGRGEAVANERKFFDIADLPLPDYDGLPLRDYGGAGLAGTGRTQHADLQAPHQLYQITRGCPYMCSFCSLRLVAPRLERRAAGQAVGDLARLKDRYGIDHFYFCELALNVSYRYLEELCDAFIAADLGIRWMAPLRMSHMDAKLLRKMMRAGCYGVVWGLESGSDRVLQLMNKGFSASHAAGILKEAHSLGIFQAVNIVAGYVGELDGDVDKTIAFLRENARYIGFVRLFPFSLLPFSPVHDRPAEFGVENIGEEPDSPVGFSRKRFDEVKGPRWEEKVLQITRAHQRIRAAVDELFGGRFKD
jgi:radical SAM superfamily enzyme YgiQ (UPF0313 family)